MPKNTIFSPTEAMQFISGLEFTLTQGLPQEKLVALRQCIERIGINKPAGEIIMAIRLVPVGNLQVYQKLKVSVQIKPQEYHIKAFL